MKRLIAVACLCILATLVAPSLFACQDCVDGTTCVTQNGGSRFCGFYQDGGCFPVGTCPQLAASLQSQYRVAAVRVIEQGKPLPQAQPKPAAVQTASK